MSRTATHLLRLLIFSILVALSYRLYNGYHLLVPIYPLPISYFHFPASTSQSTSQLPLSTSTTGQCHRINAPSGQLAYCEDLEEWHSLSGDRLGLLASCDPSRRGWNTVMGPLRDPNPRGSVWLVDPSTEESVQLPLVGYPEGHDFHPLGISVLPSAPGEPTTLFAVNHGRHNSTIEVFRLSSPSSGSPQLEYVRTLTHRRILSPNAVVAISPSTVLMSQDHTFTRRLPPPLGNTLPMLESVLALPGGSVDVLQFQPSSPQAAGTFTTPTFTSAVPHFPFANGLAYSPLTQTLAVASSSKAAVYMYDLPLASSVLLLPLRHKSTTPVPFSPDNLSFSSSGTLYASGHPNFPAIIRHAKSASSRAGSWVVSISQDGETRTVFQSAGGPEEEAWNASTTAIADEEHGKVWISGLYGEGILACGPA
ncbi:calcium-dependent phosphotriesterase [Dacryopinax primogenitus]|uniref:Calcium-dependent phosphotriesterase n=1 Tax=Dacryopinax primogenitus (strain DJM 731) TaxID=1858805 RepID=M5GE86_DACPD|nr:calcium-dependent phosphotriesterase [Dacryopinax primogenitus]EJU03073.1 calcium-dependent phosphotriesterase [Dacryopinax primogenitus]